ncbi:MAG: ATP-binding protein [Methanobacterium sp.]|uniref:AlbA family DNA-binding domain-containing protein n=1 Tax=Methanobacterium sp. TaxID=2164 RepID=UPI003D6551D7|nr:ATP-binding protein [Methanobacterium sp.]
MIDKDINQITEEDLNSLKEDEVPEGKKLDYKEILPGNSQDNKKEFLKDVSAFANTSGGLLIYGISEGSDNAIPEEIKGLDISNPDDEITRLENMIRNGIEPKISPIEMISIRLSDSGKVIILVKVPKSWRSPHRVTLRGHNKFYLRISNSNHEMDVSELRNAFNLSETLTEKIKRFREDRLSNIIADEGPVGMNNSAKTVIHIIPLNSFDPGQISDLNNIYNNNQNFQPISTHKSKERYNLDGLIAYTERTSNYIQIFRDGIIEAVDENLLDTRYDGNVIPSGIYEKEILEAIKKYLAILEDLGVETPILIFISLIGVKGYAMATNARAYKLEHLRPHYLIDRDVLLLPETLLENYGIEIEKSLKLSFDSLWNACGYPESRNYNEDGDWDPK